MRRLLERLSPIVVAVTVFALPWFFAGVGGTAQFALSLCLIVAWLGAYPYWTQPSACWKPVRWPLLFLCAATALGIAQLSPSFREWVSAYDPECGAVAADFASEPSADHAASFPTLSLHAASTRRQLAGLLLAATAFLLGASVFGRTRSLLLLLGIITVTAAAVAAFGLVQKLSWNGLIYWRFSREGGLPFGPFINRNNAGAFLEIGFAAAVGLLLRRWYLIPPRLDRSAVRGERDAAVGRGIWFLANLDAPLLWSAAAVFIILAGLLATLSRGATVSITTGLLGTAAVRAAAGRSSAFAWISVPLVVGVVAFLGWLGQSEAFYQRVQTLFDADNIGNEPRLAHWQTAYSAAQDYQPFGSGLGTYRFAYTRMQQAPTESTFYYAENQYLDALMTGGYVGLGLLLALWASLVIGAWRLNRRKNDPTDSAVAATAVLLVITQTVHSCFDFGLYVPAVYVPFALLVGALLRRAADRNRTTSETPAPPTLSGRLLAVAFGLVWCIGPIWSAWELNAARVARSALLETRIGNDLARRRDAPWLTDSIDALQRAAAACPDDGEVRIRLAEMYLARYTIAFRHSLENSALDPALWQWASPNRLHADAHLLARIHDDDTLAALRKYPLIVEHLVPALAEARLARRLCPLAPYGHLLVAKLCFIDESPLNDAFYLDRAERLAGGRVDWLFEIGALHIEAARLDRGFAAWRRCWELSSKYEAVIVQTAVGYLSPEQLLRKVVPPQPAVIFRVGERFFTDPEQEPVRRTYYREAMTLLASAPNPSAEDCRQAGRCAIQLGDLTEAPRWYRRALSLDATHGDWFLEAAELAVKQDDWKTAATHAAQAFRLAPDAAGVRELYVRIENEVESRRNAPDKRSDR